MSNTYRDNYNAKTKIYKRLGYDIRPRFQKLRNDGKGSGFVGCSCNQCRWGMHSEDDVTHKVRKIRRSVKRSLRNGEYNVAFKESVGYTD